MDAPKTLTLDAAPAGAGAETEDPAITQLVDRAKAGDPDAFADLMRTYEGRIIALGIHMGLSRDDAMDACQDAFVRVFKHMARFESGRIFFKWLYRIAIHAVYHQMRRTRRHAAVDIDDPAIQPLLADRSAGGSVQARLEDRQLAGRVHECLAGLTRQERIVFVLRDLQEVPTDEIGAILRLSTITVRRHCMSARQKLRNRILRRKT
ncbi:MAG TPA: RNA polymerase sigma factor [Candidatus Polarisedimenticolia bacterium]|nr:RNA polymerase sigma factor [Candidatus Polarisedimenticolia bacterium]